MSTSEMSAVKLYTDLISNVANNLSKHHFRKKGNIIYRTLDNDVFGSIYFQKGRHSNSSSVDFTIEVGVTSLSLVRTFEGVYYFRPVVPPSANHCDRVFNERLGYLMPCNKDVWWTVGLISIGDKNSPTPEQITQDILNFAFPKICTIETLAKLRSFLELTGGRDFDKACFCATLRYIESRSQAALAEDLTTLESKALHEVDHEALQCMRERLI